MASRNPGYVYNCDLCGERLDLATGDNWHCFQCTVDLCSCCFEKTGGGRLVLVVDNKVEHMSEHAMSPSRNTFHAMRSQPQTERHCTRRRSRPVTSDRVDQKLPDFPPGVKKPVLYFYADIHNPYKEIRVTVEVEPWSVSTLSNVYPYPATPKDTQDGKMEALRTAEWDIILNSASDPFEACSFTVNGERYPYLYWDTTHKFPPLVYGMPGVDTIDLPGLATYVKRLFRTLGYNERETTDFFTYWIGAMSAFEYISFRVTTAQCILDTNPIMPVMRNWIIWTGHTGTQCIPRVELVREPSVRPTHDSFPVYAVEWGGHRQPLAA